LSAFARKLPSTDDSHRLRRCLNALDLTLLGVGNMIGTGIFVLTGVAAATQAGPAVVLSFVVAGITCAFVAFAYAELAASVGGCGGAYGYAYAAFGELPAWIAGWNLIFCLGTALAAVANGWSGYFDNALEALGLHLPDALIKGAAAGGVVNLPAAAIILVVMLTLFSGVKQSATVNNLIVAVKLLAIALFLAVAAFHLRPALWRPFMPFGWFGQTQGGSTAGILAAASLVFFAYRGFQNVSVAVEEARNPRRDIPIGVLASLAICTAIYLAVSGALTGIAPYQVLNNSSPIAYALLRLGYGWGSALVATGVIVGLTSTMLALYYALTRTLFAMGRDGLLPGVFSVLNSRTKTPINAVLLGGTVMAAIAGVAPLGALAQLANAGTLTEFIMVCVGVIVLRRRSGIVLSFRTPGGIFIPLLGIASCTALLNFLPPMILVRYAAYLAAGFAVYFLYAARRHRSARGALGENPL
jgi:basic amino acid/polyamine antiporter, APA family